MNITKKIIVTDTNIITDLNNAKVLKEFSTLDNVYITNLEKHDEINSNTGDIDLINNFKVINATTEQLQEISTIRKEKPKLSSYDALNYIIARDNDCILATGDKPLKSYSEKKGIQVIRILKIIKLMKDKNIISEKKAIKACHLLKEETSTRVPKKIIDNFIEDLKKNTIHQ